MHYLRFPSSKAATSALMNQVMTTWRDGHRDQKLIRKAPGDKQHHGPLSWDAEIEPTGGSPRRDHKGRFCRRKQPGIIWPFVNCRSGNYFGTCVHGLGQYAIQGVHKPHNRSVRHACSLQSGEHGPNSIRGRQANQSRGIEAAATQVAPILTWLLLCTRQRATSTQGDCRLNSKRERGAPGLFNGWCYKV